MKNLSILFYIFLIITSFELYSTSTTLSATPVERNERNDGNNNRKLTTTPSQESLLDIFILTQINVPAQILCTAQKKIILL